MNIDLSSNFSIKSIFNKVSNFVSKLTKNVISSVTRNVSKIINSVKNAVVFDVGLGVGDNMKYKLFGKGISVGYYNDRTLKIENGKIEVGNSIGAGLQTPIDKVHLGTEYFHKSHNIEGDFYGSLAHSELFPLISNTYNCPESEPLSSLSYNSENNETLGIDNAHNIFLGYETNLHSLIGGHIRFGFNISWSQ